MARPELGKKHTCPECGKKYYDLNRDQAECPGCGHVIEAESTAPSQTEEEVDLIKTDKPIADVVISDDKLEDDETGLLDGADDIEALPGADVGDDTLVVEEEDISEVVEEIPIAKTEE